MSNQLLKGKKGIIFGALDEKSIAWKTALACHEQGAQIVLTNAPVALRMGEINKLAEKCQTEVIAADATSVNIPNEIISKLVAAWGGIDVIILNAGEADVQKIEDTTDAIWEKTLAINTTAPFRFIRAVTPIMKTQNSGRVIVIASIAGLMGEAFVTAYAASKHAVVGVVRASAIELNKYGITVNALCPGYVDTPMLDKGLDVTAARTGKTRDELRAALALKQPGGRLLTSDEVASAAIDFISNGETGQARWLYATTIGEKK